MDIYNRYGYHGLKDGGTFRLDTTTTTTIKADPKQIEGKAVTLTGNYEVGYGSDGDTIFGIVEKVENEQGRSETLCVSVLWQSTFEDIPSTGSETAGTPLVVDGNGGVKAGTAFSGTVALGADSTKSTCTIRVM